MGEGLRSGGQGSDRSRRHTPGTTGSAAGDGAHLAHRVSKQLRTTSGA